MAKAKLTNKQREQVINALVTNEHNPTLGVFQESDRDLLNNADDARLAYLYDKHMAQVEYETTLNALAESETPFVFNGEGFVPTLKHRGDTSNQVEEEGEENADDNEGDDQGNDNYETESGGSKKHMSQNERIITRSGAKLKPQAPAKPITANEWLKTAPPEIRSVVQNAIQHEHRTKAALIEVITANERNNFAPEYLATKDVQELQAIAALASNGQTNNQDQRFLPDYMGAAGPITNQVQNAKFDDQDNLLPLPTMNFAKPDKTANDKKQHQA